VSKKIEQLSQSLSLSPSKKHCSPRSVRVTMHPPIGLGRNTGKDFTIITNTKRERQSEAGIKADVVEKERGK
jgi:hypothetical protein